MNSVHGHGTENKQNTTQNTNSEPLFRAHIKNPSLHGDELRGPCPFHDDHTPSWSGNRVTGMWKCHACGAQGNAYQFAERVGEKLGNGHQHRRIVATYDYTDETGNLLYQSVRSEPKDFRQRRPDGNGGWLWNLKDTRQVPYHLPEILHAETVYIDEGEKDTDRLRALGITATTNSGGAGKWREEYNFSLAGKHVVILPDNDKPGEQHALQVARSLLPVAASVKVVHLSGLPPKGDVSDWLDAGHTKEELLALVEATPVFRADETDNTTTEPAWPVLAEDALYGLAGDIVNTIDPYTEADKVAVLVTLLAMFGNCVNASAHFLVEYTKHFLRLFVTLVGRTAKGRKGQSLSTLRYIFEQIDADWLKDRVVFGGLSSGEGVIDAVRDARRDEEGEVIDAGEPDKRLLLIEEELVSALKVASREGNTLSAILRQAWDRGDLRPLTKHNKIRATGAHVSIVAHITQEELLRYLTATEQSNGFGNRFIWPLVRRSKLIPRPVPVPTETLAPLIERLRLAVDFARKTTVMDRDTEAEAKWATVYPSLSEGKPGLFGAIIGRAEVQVMRLACLYALLDCSTVVSVVHLQAALALWDYAEDSARLIFGDSTGNPTADEILTALRSHPAGLTRTDIRDLFGRNRKAEDIEGALMVLFRNGLAHRVSEKPKDEAGEETKGRPIERWFITEKARH